MKDLKQIEEILDKYYRGETSSEEENLLRMFFSGPDIPEHLKSEAELFAYFKREQDNTLTGDMERRLVRMISGSESRTPVLAINRRYYWVTAAAVILILIGLFLDARIRRNSSLEVRQDTFENPYLAYTEAKKVLYLMSDKMNTARKPLMKVEKLEEGLNYMHPVFSFGAGIDNLEYLSTIKKTRERLSE
jgi:hypothetical protein